MTSQAGLELWLKRELAPIAASLSVQQVRYSLGPQAEHAYDFDGLDFLVHFLARWGSRDERIDECIRGGVTELVENAGRSSGERTYRARECFDGLREVGDDESATAEEATQAAYAFYALARAALVKARFGGQERAADIARFETFRLVTIAAEIDDEVSSGELEVLANVLRWDLDDDVFAGLAEHMVRGVERVKDSTSTFSAHSLVLKIVGSNSTVTGLLADAAVETLQAVLRLDGLGELESDALASLAHSPSNANLERDLELIDNTVFVFARHRSGLMRHDPEFDQLWVIYAETVPWSTPEG